MVPRVRIDYFSQLKSLQWCPRVRIDYFSQLIPYNGAPMWESIISRNLISYNGASMWGSIISRYLSLYNGARIRIDQFCSNITIDYWQYNHYSLLFGGVSILNFSTFSTDYRISICFYFFAIDFIPWPLQCLQWFHCVWSQL